MKSTKDPTIQESESKRKKPPVSRRGFIQGTGVGTAVLGAAVMEETAEAQSGAASGPGAVEITLTVNGKMMKATVEPRVTLLDCLRTNLDLTAAKRVCDRGTCGACTVMVDGKVMYACSVLAIDAQGRRIETLEALSEGSRRVHPLVQAFVNNDAQQCGYCTPGFVMAAKGLLDRNPNPSYEQVKKGLGGNLCRCGTYVGVRKAVLDAAQEMKKA